jgi:hypothetical protein
MGVSALLLSLEWFTWQAWIFVSLFMIMQYCYFAWSNENLLTMTRSILRELNDIKSSITRCNSTLDSTFNANVDYNEELSKKLEKIRKILIHEVK